MILPVMAAIAILLLLVGLMARRRQRPRRRTRRRVSVGPGAAGAIYDFLNEDKRRAVEIVVEQRAERRDPEFPQGNLPDLEDPRDVPHTPPGSKHGSG